MRQVVLLRGVNVGGHNRLPMAELRESLSTSGFGEVATLLQSGNLVVASPTPATQTAETVRTLIADRFGLDILCIGRDGTELARVVARNPLPQATDPKHHLVSFLAKPAPAGLDQRLRAAAQGREAAVRVGREIFSWHPDGIARSPLWTLLAGKTLGVAMTARNWNTVQQLATMSAA